MFLHGDTREGDSVPKEPLFQGRRILQWQTNWRNLSNAAEIEVSRQLAKHALLRQVEAAVEVL
jgi:hypothetical protein